MTTLEYICYLIGFCYVVCFVLMMLVIMFLMSKHAYKWFKQRLNDEVNYK